MDTAKLLSNYKRYREDPWAFLTECVYTLDQVDSKNPIKRFPNRKYLQLFVKLWVKYPLIAVPKSRRMTMSWTIISLCVWDILFHKGRFVAFVSKKEDDADELVKRAKFILDNLDQENFPKDLIPRYESKFNLLYFPETNSKIQGFPQGADQLRQFTFSRIFGDECAFWEDAQKFYAASFPTIDGGGAMNLVSSPAPGFFKRLCYDAMDQLGDIQVAEYTPDAQEPIKGVRTWVNKKNKFLVIELHYTADVAKQSVAYKESIKSSMPLMEYLMEYELEWDTFKGFPVYPEYNKVHECLKMPGPALGLPMLIGFDFGLTPACVIGQYQEGVLYVFEELVEVNMGITRFKQNVIAHIRLKYPEWSDLGRDWLCYVDPSGLFRKDTDETTCAQILSLDGGFNPRPGPVTWEERKKSVYDLLSTLTLKGPALQVDHLKCPVLHKGFKGGYHYPEKASEIEPNRIRPVKNEYSHVHDALQYVCSGIKSITTRQRRTIPSPSYSTRSVDQGNNTSHHFNKLR